jgi:1-aminocyclopropane-1-carboxylate deaminase
LHTKATISNLNYYQSLGHDVDMLRLDLVHPIVSGNKWYKLKAYLEEAKEQNAKTLASFGGPYSNHIVALAYAGQYLGFNTIGYIRTNENEPITPSLQEALNYGMQLVYLGRTHFQEKKNELLNNQDRSSIYFINEGGYGKQGCKGFASIQEEIDLGTYDYILAAVGTGTMLSGLISISKDHQEIIGIPVLKNEESIHQEINAILPDPSKPYTLLHQFHQGGYAKTTPTQIDCMNAFWKNTGIPTDIVYTGKLAFALDHLLKENYFKKDARILIVHSGGLQGNRSLPKGVLLY